MGEIEHFVLFKKTDVGLTWSIIDYKDCFDCVLGASGIDAK